MNKKLKEYLTIAGYILLGFFGGVTAAYLLERHWLKQLKKKGYIIKCYLVKDV